MSASPAQRLASMKAVCEHALELANGGRQGEAERLLEQFIADPEAPYPPHAQTCGTCKTKAKVPAHGGFGNGVSCLNCGNPT